MIKRLTQAFFVIPLALALINASASGQFVSWKIVRQYQLRGPIGTWDSLFNYYAISCAGKNCTVVGTVEDPKTPIPTSHVIFYRSHDGGITWGLQTPGFDFPISSSSLVKIHQIDSLNVALTADSGCVIRTFDAGKHWEKQQCPTDATMLDIDFHDPLNGIAVSGKLGLFITSDGGNHWQSVSFTGFSTYQCHSFGNNKYSIYNGNGQIFTTTDNFKHFTASEPFTDSIKHPDLKGYILRYCKFEGDTVFVFGKIADSINAFAGRGLIIRSTNGGKSWGLPFAAKNLTQISQVEKIGANIYIASGMALTNSYLLSTNSGESWIYDSLSADTMIMPYLCNGITATSDGHPLIIYDPGFVLRGDINELDVEASPIAVLFDQHIYPNPASSNVTISVGVKGMPLGIYDMLGREIIKEMVPESGKLQLDLSQYPTGAYNVLLYDHKRTIPLGKIILKK